MKNINSIKSIIICSIICFLSITNFSLQAQDKIHKTDNTIIETNVTEINDTQIKYKNYNNPNGPEYTIPISEVYMIVYKNGDKEIYNTPKVIPTTPITNTQVSTEVKPSNNTTTNTNNTTSTKTNSTNNTSPLKQEPVANNDTKTDINKGLYFTFGPGIGTNAASQAFDPNTTGDNTSGSFESVNGSLGKGFTINVGLGYFFNKNVAFDLGFSILKGNAITTTITDNTSLPSNVTENNRKASITRITPGFTICSSGSKIKPYAKVGLIIGLAGKMTSEYSETASDLNKTTEYTGHLAIGYSSALGLIFGTKKISFFSEIGLINQAWAPAKSEITEYTINGFDLLPNMTTSSIETEYVKDYSSSTSSDTNSPAQKPIKYFPLSSVGINLGIRLSF